MADSGNTDAKAPWGAEFCLNKCPSCKYPRKKGKGLLYKWLRIEAKICPMCKSYEKHYGVPVWEYPPES